MREESEGLERQGSPPAPEQPVEDPPGVPGDGSPPTPRPAAPADGSEMKDGGAATREALPALETWTAGEAAPAEPETEPPRPLLEPPTGLADEPAPAPEPEEPPPPAPGPPPAAPPEAAAPSAPAGARPPASPTPTIIPASPGPDKSGGGRRQIRVTVGGRGLIVIGLLFVVLLAATTNPSRPEYADWVNDKVASNLQEMERRCPGNLLVGLGQLLATPLVSAFVRTHTTTSDFVVFSVFRTDVTGIAR